VELALNPLLAPFNASGGEGAFRPAEEGEDSSDDEQQVAVGAEPSLPGSAVPLRDARALPPSYKAEHAKGKRLCYQLHATLARVPPTFILQRP
jgi:hypothetical protein